jgi:hypothetical protein
MFIDPNAMLVLQEVSLDLLCDVCVEIGRERRLAQISGSGGDNGTKKGEKSFGALDGKVRRTAFLPALPSAFLSTKRYSLSLCLHKR